VTTEIDERDVWVTEPESLTIGKLNAAVRRLRDEVTAARASRSAPPAPARFFDKRAADVLACEVQRLIERKVIDSRSPAADALLDYVDPGPNESVPELLAASPAPPAPERAEIERLAKELRESAYDLGAIRYDPRSRGRDTGPDKKRMDKAEAAVLAAFDRALAAMREERDEAERWRVAVADGLGYLNRPEGQGGYEVAEPSVIIKAFRDLSADADALHDGIVEAEMERSALAAQDGLREAALEEAARTVAATEPAFAYGIPDASDTLIRAAARVRALSTPAAPRCHCTFEAGDSPCPMHGMDEEDPPTPAAPKKETEHHE
jgi:hypothetical protein